jgi:hypothetical protein
VLKREMGASNLEGAFIKAIHAEEGVLRP